MSTRTRIRTAVMPEHVEVALGGAWALGIGMGMAVAFTQLLLAGHITFAQGHATLSLQAILFAAVGVGLLVGSVARDRLTGDPAGGETA